MSSNFASNFDSYEFSPKLEALLEIQRTIRDKGTEILALYHDSIAGFEMLAKHLSEWEAAQRQRFADMGIDVDNELWSDMDHFIIMPPPHGHDSEFTEFARTLADYRTRIASAGRNSLLAGNYAIIALYQLWDDSWRCRIADALGHDHKNKVLSDFWGDVRLIRHCLIHMNGIADKDVATKSKLLRWFNESDTIVIDREKMKLLTSGFLNFLYTELIGYEKMA